ncbi:HesA/MoeB/ThiF family protein [Nocardia salmonicida]|uniref:HesA/MoeB/ThiF family protein n=1 Tax=Nocardia salmonicida TaxID=53431 RepID=UPI0037AB937C
MSLAVFDDDVAYARMHFEEGLLRAGFVEIDGCWQGSISHTAGTTQVEVRVPSNFPFAPARVKPVDSDAVEWSWHRELDGALCLIAEDDHEGLWWADADAFLEQVVAWFEQSDAGWPDDRPDLDIDRYFPLAEDERLYLYNSLAFCSGAFVRFRPGTNNTMRMARGGAPVSRRAGGKDRFGLIIDIGEIDLPPRTWGDIAAHVTDTANIERRIRERRVTVLVVIYRRSGRDGVMVLDAKPANTTIVLTRLRSSADTPAIRMVRAGEKADRLRTCSVAIVGVGAVGAFLTDILVRCGVGRVTLIDDDIVMPGNLIRHLVGPSAVGQSKVAAVKQHLVARFDIAGSDVVTAQRRLLTRDDMTAVLDSHNLVVNATADFTTTAMLHAVARALHTPIVSAALQNSGTTCRVDVLPPLHDSEPLPPSSRASEDFVADLFEPGCASPVSPASPQAVVETAAVAARHAVGLLTGTPVHPAGEVRDLTRSPQV